MNPETRLKNACLRYAKEKKLMTIKFADRFFSGWPDIGIFRNNIVSFYELKSEFGKLSKIQEYVIKRLREEGFTVHEIRTLDQFKEAVNGIYFLDN